MKRLILILAALCSISVNLYADDGDEGEDIIIEPSANIIDFGELVLGKRYEPQLFSGYKLTFHATQDGLLRVMSNTSDYPWAYHDAGHTELYDCVASYYSDGQGYVLSVHEGEVIYLYRDFCMNGGKVWAEMMKPELNYTLDPAPDTELQPVGIAQVVATFGQPVNCSGGTMTCGGQTVELSRGAGHTSLVYDIKGIVMDWIASGIPAGSDITVVLNDVCASADPTLKAGDDGTITFHYLLPEAPGQLVSTNFEERTFMSYWLPDDEEGVFRMTFTRPVSVDRPGQLNLVYGVAEVGQIGTVTLPGYADGYDLVFDLRDTPLRPTDIITSVAAPTTYETIRIHPLNVYDDRGLLMYSEGSGTMGSYTYELPYTYLSRKLTTEWEVTGEDGDDLDVVENGQRIEIYIYDYNYVACTGVLMTFDGEHEVLVPLSDIDIERDYVAAGERVHALLSFTTPYVEGDYEEVTFTLANFRVINGDPGPNWSATFDWRYTIPTGLAGAPTQSRAQRTYDLAGRRTSPAAPAHINIESGRKVVR